MTLNYFTSFLILFFYTLHFKYFSSFYIISFFYFLFFISYLNLIIITVCLHLLTIFLLNSLILLIYISFFLKPLLILWDCVSKKRCHLALWMVTESFMPFPYYFSSFLDIFYFLTLVSFFRILNFFSLEFALHVFQFLCIQILFLFSLELALHVFQFLIIMINVIFA